MESKLQKAEKNLKDLTEEWKEFKERSKTFNDILNKNNNLERQLKLLKVGFLIDFTNKNNTKESNKFTFLNLKNQYF